MHFVVAGLLSLAGSAAALPMPLPQVAAGAEAAPHCASNEWEKFHETHWHDINNGRWMGIPTPLIFPGGSGCYYGQKVSNFWNLGGKKSEPVEVPEWMKKLPGYAAAQAASGTGDAWQKPESQVPGNTQPQYQQPQYQQPQYQQPQYQQPQYQQPQYPQPQYQQPQPQQSEQLQQPQQPQYSANPNPQPSPAAGQQPQGAYSPYTPVLNGSPSGTQSAALPRKTFTDPNDPSTVIVVEYSH